MYTDHLENGELDSCDMNPRRDRPYSHERVFSSPGSPSLFSMVNNDSAYEDSDADEHRAFINEMKHHEGVPKKKSNKTLLEPGQSGQLMKLRSSYDNRIDEILIDCGATKDFISSREVIKRKLKPESSGIKLNVKLADGSVIISDKIVKNVPIFVGDHIETRDLHVIDMKGLTIVLGMPWLTERKVLINFGTRTLEFKHQGTRHIIEADKFYSINEDHLDIIRHDELERHVAIGDAVYAVNIVQKGEMGDDEAVEAHAKAAETSLHVLHLQKHAKGTKAYITAVQDVGKSVEKAKSPEDVAEANFRETIKPDGLLTEELYEELAHAIRKNSYVATPMTELPTVRQINNAPPVVLEIKEIPGSTPPCKNAYRLSAAELRELKKQLDELLSKGYVRPSDSPYGAPVLFVPKKDGTLRMCLDFRALNAQTIKDRYPLPRDQDLFDQFKGANYFTTLDCLNGYYVVPIHQNSIHKTTIRTQLGSFEWLVMPFGLCNAPSVYQRMIENILKDYLTDFVMVFLDDIAIYTKGTAKQHMEHVSKVLEALAKHKLKVKLSKCSFFKSEVEYLGHIISGDCIKPDPKKLKTVNEWPEPTNNTQVQAFVGLVNYYNKMIKDYAKIAAPLTDIMATKWSSNERRKYWKRPQQHAFVKLKEAMCSEPLILHLPDPDKPYIVSTDASLKAVGCILHQLDDDGNKRVVAYASKKFNNTEQNWPTHERELFGFVYAFKKWRHYLYRSAVTIEGDHKPLTWIKTQKTLTAKQARWLERLEEFDYEVKYIPGKDLAAPDAISRRVDFMTYLSAMAPVGLLHDSHVQKYLLHALLTIMAEEPERLPAIANLPKMQVVDPPSPSTPPVSSNRGRASDASILGGGFNVPPRILDDGSVDVWCSQYRVQRHLGTLNTMRALALPDVTDMFWVPEDNTSATHSWLTLRSWVDQVQHMYLGDPFAKRILEGEEHEKFFADRGIVYYRPTDLEFPVMYVSSTPECKQLLDTIISEFHEVPLAGHMSKEKTLERLQRFFYWKNMHDSVDAFIKSCDGCARAKRRTVPRPNQPVPFPIPDAPWEVVAMDMKSGYDKTSRGNDAAWVFVDKLTRRAHIVPCNKSHDTPALARMYMDNVVRHHGVPRRLISDRDPKMTAKFWQQLQQVVGTRLNMSTAHRAMTDGGSERYIQTITSMLRAFVQDNPKDWDLYIAAVEFAYNDSIHPETGFTPFQLDMGRDPSTPMQLLMQGVLQRPALYAGDDTRIDPTVYLSRFSSNLHLAKQTLKTRQRAQWQRLVNKTTIPTNYVPGDYVYVENPKSSTSAGLRSLEERYQGPFKILSRHTENTYEIDFGINSRRHPMVNVDKLRPYTERATGSAFPTTVPAVQTFVRSRPPNTSNQSPPLLTSPKQQHDPHTQPKVQQERVPMEELQKQENWSTELPMPPPIVMSEVPIGAYQHPCLICSQRGQSLQTCLKTEGHEPRVKPTSPPLSNRTRHPAPPIRRSHMEITSIRDHRITLSRDNPRREAKLIAELNVTIKTYPEPQWVELEGLMQAYPPNWNKILAYLQTNDKAQAMQPMLATISITHDGKQEQSIIIEWEANSTDPNSYKLLHSNGDTELVNRDYIAMGMRAHGTLNWMRAMSKFPRGRQLRVLDLCSGGKSMSKALRSLCPHAKIVTVDVDAKTNPTHCADVRTWKPAYVPGYFDLIWASPPCDQYSRANTTGIRDLEYADSVAKACLQLIRELKPKAFVVENPLGMLRERDFMMQWHQFHIPVTYCKYGFDYMKETDLWTNVDVSLQHCKQQPCMHYRTHKRHPMTAQRGPSRGGVPGCKSTDVLYRVPPKLIQAIVIAAFS